MVKLIFSDNYKRVVSKIKDAFMRERIEKILFKIANNPEIGKPMKFDRKGTREVYIRSSRLSYSYNKNIKTIYLLDFYHKDEQ
ncbi:hypothetical protein J4229_01130 [Candidatus Pacearchaeota archaeon]|nr:hypothetical protein [Candidatus Pacearchaeota archaeon]